MCSWLAAHGLATAETAGPEAVFSATPLKSSFIQGEAVQLLLRLRNNGQRTLIVDGNLAMGNSVHPSVIDSQGKVMNWNRSFGAGQPAFQTLAPGASLTRVVCLNCGIHDPFSDPFEQPGTYTARLEYSASAVAAQAKNFPNAVPLAQTLVAPPFPFQISQAQLVFTAQPTQPVFHLREPVTFDFRLQNRTKQSVLTAYDLSLGDAVRLRVVNENGKEVSWTGQPTPSSPMLATVSAGHSVDSVYPITPTNLFGTIVAGCDIREPGMYTAYAVYWIPETFNVLQAYVGVIPILIVPGPIPAPPVKFTVQATRTSLSNGR